jgi:hypothetical protein
MSRRLDLDAGDATWRFQLERLCIDAKGCGTFESGSFARRNPPTSSMAHLPLLPRRAALTTLAAVVAACVLLGCEQSDDSASAASVAPVASITLAPSTAVALGTTTVLAAQLTDAQGKSVEHKTVSWSVADPTIASVDAAGTVTPLQAGFTSITATVDGSSASATLSVRGPVAIPTRSQYVGMNLSGIAYWTTQFPFADLMKNGSGWSSRDNSGTWGAAFPSMKDGYPTALNPAQHALFAVAWSSVHYAPGQYTILWDGDGDISFPLSNVAIQSSAAHRIVINVTDTSGAIWVGIDRTNPADPVRNVRFLWPGSEATYATQPFNLDFLKKVAPFSVLRFMDWGATNGSPVVEWADRSQVSDVMYANPNGVPIEIMIALANSLHVDPWFCVPHQASDDYVRQFATLVHTRLDPGLHPHIEYSNEVWNTGFAQTTWALGRSTQLGLATPWGTPSVFYAQRSVAIFKIFQSVYGPADSGRIVRVVAGQAAWTQFLENALAYGDTAANADVLAVAPYFGAASAGDPAQVATTLTLTSDQVVDQMLVNIRGDIKTWMQANAALATKYKLKLKAYESGAGDSSSYFPADKQDAMTALFSAAHRNPRMKDVYDEYFNQWIASGGDTMNQFNDVGGWSKWGLWGSLEYVTQDPASAPKYQGLLDVIAKHPAAP